MDSRDSSASHLHPVEAAALGRTGRVTDIELVVDVDVEVPLVLVVGTVLDAASDSLVLLDGENVTQVEDGLLPVGVLGMRTGGEANGLVACGELDVEPRNQSVDEVAATGSERVRHLEREVGGRDGVKVKGDDWARIGHQRFHLHGVDQGLGESDLLHRAVVEAVNIVPD